MEVVWLKSLVRYFLDHFYKVNFNFEDGLFYWTNFFYKCFDSRIHKFYFLWNACKERSSGLFQSFEVVRNKKCGHFSKKYKTKIFRQCSGKHGFPSQDGSFSILFFFCFESQNGEKYLCGKKIPVSNAKLYECP